MSLSFAVFKLVEIILGMYTLLASVTFGGCWFSGLSARESLQWALWWPVWLSVWSLLKIRSYIFKP